MTKYDKQIEKSYEKDFQRAKKFFLEGRIDKALIVSGGADFIDAIRKLKELKKKFEVWSFKIIEYLNKKVRKNE